VGAAAGAASPDGVSHPSAISPNKPATNRRAIAKRQEARATGAEDIRRLIYPVVSQPLPALSLQFEHDALGIAFHDDDVETLFQHTHKRVEIREVEPS